MGISESFFSRFDLIIDYTIMDRPVASSLNATWVEASKSKKKATMDTVDKTNLETMNDEAALST